jgi:hypothetical protein
MSVESSQYLSIVFFESHVLTALWQELGGKITIIARSTLRPVISEETLAEAVDLSLEELGEDGLSVRRVLFVIPQVWSDQGEIREQRKNLLKSLSKELLLEPLGFVLIEDSIRLWQEQLSNQPFSGVLIQHLEEDLRVQVVLNGEITSTFRLGKSGEVRDDLLELQARLKPYANKYEKVMYYDTSGKESEYNQLLVLLRQQLEKPVEKLTPQQIADIAISSGGQEMLGAISEPVLSEPDPVTPASSLQDDEFRPPSFAVNQSGGAHQADIISHDLPADTAEESIANVEPLATVRPKRKFSLPRFRFPKFSKKNRLTYIIGAVIAFLGVISLVGYVVAGSSYTVQFEVTLHQQSLETTTVLPLALETATESAQAAGIPAQELTETITVTKEVPTTGTKLTGDPAKGTVIIYNKTSESKTFEKGTKIHLGSKSFSLDEGVTVASASAEEQRNSRTTKFGEAQVNVTADTFGPDGNIAEKQEMSVDDFGHSSFYAYNEKAFTGGTSREIQAVAQKDIQSALSALKDEALQTLHERFEAKGTESEPVLVTDTLDVQKQESSVQVGQEAKLVTVGLTVAGKAYQLNLLDLEPTAREVFDSQIQSGFSIKSDSLSLTNTRLVEDGVQPKLEVQLKAVASPHLDTSTLSSELQGEFISRAQSRISDTAGVASVRPSVKPGWLSVVFRRVPKEIDRIRIEVETQ